MRLVTNDKKQAIPRIGISGWRYAGWRGKFYPKGLAQRTNWNTPAAFLPRSRSTARSTLSNYFPAISAGTRRRRTTFFSALKAPRYITHLKRLRDVKVPLANFFASGLLALRDKLGPILWQFPPQFQWNKSQLSDFFKLLPRDTIEQPGYKAQR